MTPIARMSALSLAVLTVTPACISPDRVVADATTAPDASPDAAPPTCTLASECGDDDPCTTDRCDETGHCRHDAVAACERCASPADCHAARDACDVPHCDDGHCTYSVLDACRPCTDLATCADSDPCTTERCDTTCRYDATPCDDLDPCTADRCDPVDGCVHDDACPAPTIALGEPTATLTEGERLLRGGRVTGPASETFTATVRWTASSAPEPLPLGPDGAFTLDHVYLADGAHTLTVTATDAHGRTADAPLAVTVANVAPAFDLTAPPPAREGDTVTFTGRVLDPGDDVTAVVVDFGDGSPPTPVPRDPSGAFSITHVYADDDAVAATFTATDDRTATPSAVPVAVANVDPTFVPPAHRVVPEGTPTPVELAIVDPGADTWTGEVHYGRGGAFEPLAIADGRFALALDYPDDGVNYTVTVRLYDDDGGASTGAFVVTAENVAPAVAPPEDVQLVEGAPFVTLVPFTDPGADAWTALVSYGDGSGLVELPVDAAARAVPLAHAWPDDGTFVVFVQVTDDGGASDGESFLAAVANAAPAPNAGGDVIVPEGTAFSRDAVALDPGAGDALTGVVRWGVGEADETLAIDPLTRGYRLERRWEDEGTHEVAVTVRDDDDGVATEVFTVAVANVAPAVDCGSPAVLAVGEAFVRGCAFTDPGADAWTASVDWGDGGEPEALEVGPGGALALEHTFAAEGTFAVTVAVDDGTEVGRASLEVAVGNAPPLVALGGPAVADEGAAFVRAGQAFDAGPGPFAAVVDWGDGGEAEALALDEALAFELSHVYADEGVYTVSVEVTDGDAETGTGQVAVTVRNVAPTVVAGGDAALAEGGRLVRTVGASDPGVNDALTATVDYGDGGGAVALGAGPPWTLDHVYGQDGAYAVVVAVSDGDGGVGEGRFTAQVANGAPVVSAGGPGAATEGAAFTREVTFSDAGADTWTATVAWGDGATVNIVDIHPGAPIPLAHTYVDDGQYVVRVTVRDGAASGEASFTVTVANAAPTVSAGGAGTATEGSAFTRAGALTDPGALDVLTATVSWGDGSPVEALPVGAGGAFTLSHVFAQDGPKTVTVVASDGQTTGSASFTVAVANVTPVLAPGAAASTPEGALFTRTVTFTDPGADTWTATVDWGGGLGPQVLPVGPGKVLALAHTFPDDGSFTASIALSDGTATGTAQLAITVTNVAPTVDAGGPVTLAEGGTLTRTGTVTDPGASDTFTATVNYGDNTGTLPLPITPQRTFALAHAYAHGGLHTVTVTVTDHRSASATDTFDVTVSNSAPVVTPGPAAALTEGQTLTRAVAFTDAGGGPWTATVDYDLGLGPETASVDPTARTVALSRLYPDDGAFDVVITVHDGAESGQGSFPLTVANAPPTVTLGAAATVPEGTPFTRDGTITDPGPLDTHTVDVDWGDGTPHGAPVPNAQRAFALAHTFADNATFTVRATAFDGDDSGAGTVSVKVDNVAPAFAALAAPTGLRVGDRWLDALPFTDPGADTWTYRVDYGDGTIATGDLATRLLPIDHTYALPGSYTVTLRVTDDDGGFATTPLTVPVANVAPAVSAGADRTTSEGQPLTLQASFDDPGPETHTATIAWRPGVTTPATVDEVAQRVTGTTTYPDDDALDVTVTVTDQFGASGSDVVRVTVENVDPVVDAGGDGTTDPLGAFTRAGSFGDPGADVWTVTVDYGDGAAPTTVPAAADKTFTLSHTYASPGDHVVEVVVTDGDGGVGVDVFEVSADLLDCSSLGGATGKLWLGGANGAPTGWSAASNWYPAGAPGTTDDVRLCAGNVYYPVLTGPVSVRDVRMASTASINVASRNLTVAGHLVGGTVAGSGAVIMTGAGRDLATTVPSLAVTGTITATAPLTVKGPLGVSGGGRLGLAQVAVLVQGAASVAVTASGGGLVLDQPGDLLQVKGNFTVTGESSTTPVVPTPTLTAGTLQLAADFKQEGGANSVAAFAPTGTLVELNGTARQKVSFSDPGLARSRFHGLSVTNVQPIDLATDLAVAGPLVLGASAQVASTKKLTLGTALPTFGAGAIYEVTDTVIGGTVTATASVTLAWAKANLTIRSDGSLVVGPHTLDLGGSLTVTLGPDANRGLFMNHAQSTVIVRGATTFERPSASGGGATPPTPLTAGTLRVLGPFKATSPTNTGAVPAFAPTGLLTRFEGAGLVPQTVQCSPGANTFAGLELAPGASLQLTTEVNATGTLRTTSAAAPAKLSGEQKLSARGVDVQGLVVDKTTLDLGTAPFTRLEDVRFTGHAPTSTPLTIRADALDATAHRLVFGTVPTSGRYISGVDSAPGNNQSAKLAVEDSYPLHGTPWCTTTGQFTIAWGDATDDTDDDQLPDAAEHAAVTSPIDADSDDDTFLDGAEVGLGTDPLAPKRYPFGLAPPLELPVGADPTRVALGHFDADGALDLATANPGDDSITLWFGSADSTTLFSERVDVPLPSGAAPEALAFLVVGGVRVVAVAETGLDLVSFIGYAQSSPGGPIGTTPTRLANPLAACDAPSALVTGRFDTNATDDLAVTCRNAGTVRVFRQNTGAAGFLNATWVTTGSGATPDYAVGPAPSDLAAAGLSWTGRPDLATADSGGLGTATVLQNRTLSPGTFQFYAGLAAPEASGVALGDLDGDTFDRDLVVVLAGAGQAQVYWYDSAFGLFGGFIDGPRVDLGAAPRGAALGDLDGNGGLDLATAARGDDAVELALQAKADDGVMVFYRHRLPGLDAAGEQHVVLHDLDGDGWLDLVVVAADRDSVVVWRNLGPGVATDAR